VGKHESSILGRLKQHQDVINGNALKYTRLSNKYMRHYSFDPNFPLHSANNNVSKFINLVKHYNGNREVEYFNDSDVLNLIYGKVNIKIKGKKGHYPINEQLLLHTNNQIQDTLNDLVCSKNNFFFMYADIYTLYNYVGSNNCYIREYASSILRKFEALTVINLKGKTLGKFEGADTIIKSMSKCPPLIFDSLQNSGFDIFKNPNNLFEPTNAPKQLKNIDFPGYINELNIQH
jgi:hypothetical protein